MAPGPARSTVKRRRNGGFALIIVLWTLVLIAFITAHLVGTGRIETKIAGNLAANATTEAAMDGAVYQTIFRLMDPRAEASLPLDGSTRDIAIGDCRVTVQLHDEAARINPNLAQPALLEGLLRATGSDAATAQRLALAIAEWIGAAATPRGPDELLARDQAAGLDYGPPGEPLETLGELERVLGMTPAVFAAIRPHLSLFAPAEPLLANADPVVTAVMAQAGAIQPTTAPQRANLITVRIAAVAHGPNNARTARTVVARVSLISRTYAILSWRGDSD